MSSPGSRWSSLWFPPAAAGQRTGVVRSYAWGEPLNSDERLEQLQHGYGRCRSIGFQPGCGRRISLQSPLSRQQAWQRRWRGPKGAVVTNSRCNDVEIGYSNMRYYCVLTFTEPVGLTEEEAATQK